MVTRGLDPRVHLLSGKDDRGRESRLVSAPPPSEPDVRISRIRLSSRWFYLREDWRAKVIGLLQAEKPMLAKEHASSRSV
jgi:hypothetical protein